MSLLLSTLSLALPFTPQGIPSSPYLHPTLYLLITLYQLYTFHRASFVLPARRTAALNLVRVAMYNSMRLELEFAVHRNFFSSLAESIHLEELGEEVFRMSQGHEALRAKRKELEIKGRELEGLCGELKEAMELETRAVVGLMRVG